MKSYESGSVAPAVVGYPSSRGWEEGEGAAVNYLEAGQ